MHCFASGFAEGISQPSFSRCCFCLVSASRAIRRVIRCVSVSPIPSGATLHNLTPTKVCKLFQVHISFTPNFPFERSARSVAFQSKFFMRPLNYTLERFHSTLQSVFRGVNRAWCVATIRHPQPRLIARRFSSKSARSGI